MPKHFEFVSILSKLLTNFNTYSSTTCRNFTPNFSGDRFVLYKVNLTATWSQLHVNLTATWSQLHVNLTPTWSQLHVNLTPTWSHLQGLFWWILQLNGQYLLTLLMLDLRNPKPKNIWHPNIKGKIWKSVSIGHRCLHF